MKKNLNTEHIEGYLYAHDLAIKTVQNEASANKGKEFISGNIEIAVDEDCLNVIPVHFTYVTEMTNSGKKSPTYTNLKKILDENKTVVAVGKDECFKVSINTALALNDFYAQDGNLVSIKTNEGGFVSFVNMLNEDVNARNHWEVDMLITGVNRVEADPEKNIEADYVTVKGAIFNFRNDILPMEFKVTNPQGMKYFEDLEVSGAQPIFTKVWGRINCETLTRVVSEESAFGEAAVRTYERKVKEWIISGASKSPYDFGEEDVLTSDEVVKAMQAREVMLAETKKRAEEYKAQRAASTVAPITSGPKPAAGATATFNF